MDPSGGLRRAATRHIRHIRTRLTAATAVVSAIAAVGVTAVPTPAAADWIRDEQWQLRELNAATAWRYASGAGVTVAVIDSGVDATHPDLRGQVLPGIDLVDGATDGRVDHVGHGTTVAALIAGRTDDRSGVSGLAPGAKILPVRVLDDENRYDDAAVVARGLRWAVDHGAGVVNLSLGGAARSEALADAITYASRHDVVLVACTGNRERTDRESTGGPGAGNRDGSQRDGSPPVWYPAREPGVVAVAGLVGTGERLWPGSITGDPTVLTAPADRLLGARPGGYWWVQGTSFAAPLVAASAALVRSRWPGLDAPNVVNRLVRSAHDLGPAGRDAWYGFGEVDPLAALTAPIATVRTNPLTTAGGQAGQQIAGASEPERRAAADTVAPPRLAAGHARAAAQPSSRQSPDRLTRFWAAMAVLLIVMIMATLRRRTA